MKHLELGSNCAADAPTMPPNPQASTVVALPRPRRLAFKRFQSDNVHTAVARDSPQAGSSCHSMALALSATVLPQARAWYIPSSTSQSVHT
eukprot:1462292-Pleurochrysis_carterae.AAC.2